MYRALHRNASGAHARRVLVALLATVALFASAMALQSASASAATVPTDMFGMDGWQLPSEGQLSNVKAAGVGNWRSGLFWQYVEDTRGQRYWGDYDRLATASARQHVPILMIVMGCPRWACSNMNEPPRSPTAIAAQHDFLREAISRYGSNGSFWAAHPELPRVPVTDWQVGNEPNQAEFWSPRPNAAEYAQFLQGDAAVIRGADPRARVVMGGLSSAAGVESTAFLRQLYAQPAFRSSFDAAAVHAYEGNAAAVGRYLDRTRQVMRQNGDGRPLWITEMGWGTTSAALRTPTTPAQQGVEMQRSFDMMIGCRARWNLGRVYWFAYQDVSTSVSGTSDYAGLHTGLLDAAGRPKPAWGTLHQYRAGAQLPNGRGSTCNVGGKGPQTKIKTRKRFAHTRRAKMRFRASRRGSRFQCRLIRVRKHKGTGPRARRAARLSRRWRKCRGRYRTPRLHRGRYKLQVRAVDRAGNVDRTPATARLRIRPGSPYATVTVKVHRPKKHRRRR